MLSPPPSPQCGRVGNKHCIAAGHYVDCDIHPGSFHSALTDCVKCSHAKQRQEKEERAAAQKMKEEEDDESKNQKKKAKAPKPKPDSQKSMKQLRKEEKEKRRSEGSQDSSPW